MNILKFKNFFVSASIATFQTIGGSQIFRRQNAFRAWLVYLKNFYLKKLNRKHLIFPTGTLLSLSLWSKSSAEDDTKFVTARADKMYDAYLIDMLLEYLKPMLEKYPDNAEILWRLARATCDKGKLAKTADERKKRLYESLDYIEKAMKADDKNFAVHKWYAIILQYVSGAEGTKEKIKKSVIVKEHLEKAIELKPDDPTSWHILGVWHYTVANLSWYERKGAELFFATPPTSTFEKALELFEKAESISPNFYSQNLLMLAKTYLKLNREDLAKQYVQRTLNHFLLTVDDRDAHAEAEAIVVEKKWNIKTERR